MKMKENLLIQKTLSSYSSIKARLKNIKIKWRLNSIKIFIIIIFLVILQYKFGDVYMISNFKNFI